MNVLQRAIKLEKLGAKDVDVATTYNNLGRIHLKLDDFEEARGCFERASTIHVKKHSTKNVDV